MKGDTIKAAEKLKQEALELEQAILKNINKLLCNPQIPEAMWNKWDLVSRCLERLTSEPHVEDEITPNVWPLSRRRDNPKVKACPYVGTSNNVLPFRGGVQ